MPTTLPVPKYQRVYDALHRAIATGKFRQGDRLPSEAALGEQFGASRITITRAVRDLQRAGLVERRAGAGTFVRRAEPHAGETALTFGLLIPDLGETEIFEPICQGIAGAASDHPYALIWGGITGPDARKEAAAWDLCRQYIDRRVAGVFFAPLELTPSADVVNERIVEAFERAGIPLVLLDRPIGRGRTGRHDLVGIDNQRAGLIVTEHLLRLGVRRPAFIGQAHAAHTVDARLAGFREALAAAGFAHDPRRILRLDGEPNAGGISHWMEAAQPDAIVCANDRTAGVVMHHLLAAGYRIPGDVRLAGIDDVRYAALLPVPLSTLRQPCHDIGAAAMATMLDRLSDPDRPARDIYLRPTLVVRASCGGTLEGCRPS